MYQKFCSKHEHMHIYFFIHEIVIKNYLFIITLPSFNNKALFLFFTLLQAKKSTKKIKTTIALFHSSNKNGNVIW